MRRLRGIGLGFAAALVAAAAPTPAVADNRLFTFPDPALTFYRYIAPLKIVMLSSGPSSLARVALPDTYPAGTQLRIQGNVAALGGSGAFRIYTSGTPVIIVTATGTFDQTITLTSASNEIIILSFGPTSAEITALTVDEVV